ncbi:unnamed protein product [Prorocentrum cordatum]|uniref:Uncharacterized protein n=1 Tax=Prorocentrum cordatum TaxID=2364126 RepID=A0ABN9PL63_9DINO|nr:unnamed protein product [Polarella glacialis]
MVGGTAVHGRYDPMTSVTKGQPKAWFDLWPKRPDLRTQARRTWPNVYVSLQAIAEHRRWQQQRGFMGSLVLLSWSGCWDSRGPGAWIDCRGDAWKFSGPLSTRRPKKKWKFSEGQDDGDPYDIIGARLADAEAQQREQAETHHNGDGADGGIDTTHTIEHMDRKRKEFGGGDMYCERGAFENDYHRTWESWGAGIHHDILDKGLARRSEVQPWAPMDAQFRASPGRKQSINRMELWALANCTESTVGPLIFWTDSEITFLDWRVQGPERHQNGAKLQAVAHNGMGLVRVGEGHREPGLQLLEARPREANGHQHEEVKECRGIVYRSAEARRGAEAQAEAPAEATTAAEARGSAGAAGGGHTAGAKRAREICVSSGDEGAGEGSRGPGVAQGLHRVTSRADWTAGRRRTDRRLGQVHPGALVEVLEIVHDIEDRRVRGRIRPKVHLDVTFGDSAPSAHGHRTAFCAHLAAITEAAIGKLEEPEVPDLGSHVRGAGVGRRHRGGLAEGTDQKRGMRFPLVDGSEEPRHRLRLAPRRGSRFGTLVARQTEGTAVEGHGGAHAVREGRRPLGHPRTALRHRVRRGSLGVDGRPAGEAAETGGGHPSTSGANDAARGSCWCRRQHDGPLFEHAWLPARARAIPATRAERGADGAHAGQRLRRRRGDAAGGGAQGPRRQRARLRLARVRAPALWRQAALRRQAADSTGLLALGGGGGAIEHIEREVARTTGAQVARAARSSSTTVEDQESDAP